MPVLKNARHERFAQEVAKGNNAFIAYQIAGYKANRGNASVLKANKSIRARISEILAEAAREFVVTKADLIRFSEEARLLAMRIEQPAAAVGAIKEIGILTGERVERQKVDSNVNADVTHRVPIDAPIEGFDEWSRRHGVQAPAKSGNGMDATARSANGSHRRQVVR